MLAVANGNTLSQGDPIPLVYWQAESEDGEEGEAKYALHLSRVEWQNKQTAEGIT